MFRIDFNKLRFLVCDDNPHMRRILRTLLHSFGAREVYESEDGATALEMYSHYVPDIVITDWSMPIFDGLELAQMIRQPESKGNPYAPIIMLTGHSEKRRVTVARDAGVTEFLAKPISAKGLYQRILNVVANPRPFIKTKTYFGPDRRRNTNNTYIGIYALDTFSVTDRLTVTAGGRFNYAGISIDGQNSALLNGFSNFMHVNPTVGFTYKLTPDTNFYAGYAMTNRAPTPLELGCADPNNPCIIDNFLSSDPKLKQVVGQTFEVGFRGTNAFSQFGLGPQWGKLQWSAGLFRTTLNNDILPLQSPDNGFGFFANVGTTLRQGAEISANWSSDRWTAYANYTYLDAVYLSTFDEPSPFNPLADANGNIPITNGTQIAGIPKNTVKVGVDYAVTDKWHVGADMVAASGQVIFGNENNALPQIPGYAVFGLHTSYQVGKNFQIYGFAQNIFDQRYYTSGALFDITSFPNAAPFLTNPTSLGPGKPVAIYGGMRITL